MPADASESARRDLAFIREVVERTDRRIDPHAFHFVHWGLIVLVWYPLGTLFERMGRHDWLIALGAASLVLGTALSIGREVALGRRPRLEGENTFIGRQVGLVTAASITAGAVLSGLLPSLHFLDGHDVPTLWGFVYANLAFMVGVVYRREFLLAGVAIFAGALAAVALPDINGFILGPVMGLGIAVPGMLAERRVRALRAGARA